jgi:DNA recombination protein RmuC
MPSFLESAVQTLALNSPLALAAGALLLLLLWVVLRRSGARGSPREEVRLELRLAREESAHAARELREEVGGRIDAVTHSLVRALQSLTDTQDQRTNALRSQLAQLGRDNVDSLERVRTTLEAQLTQLREGNERHLEAMRRTVDEKLDQTLERRLGESFRLVSERLDAVRTGLGEMQALAAGVGDLKRVLSNVKARGTWAEVQLGALLEQVLTPAQFERNVNIDGQGGERVEFAVRLPGPEGLQGRPVWLPIDSKFPQEDWLRLQQASEAGDDAAAKAAAQALARAVQVAAKAVSEKYVQPPLTTDFAILFLATEGLYAEILRNTVLVEELQQRHRVVLAGPATLSALLSSLRMGFRTLAIEQRAAEVWQVLGMVKTEFTRFGALLEEVDRHLGRASESLEKTGVRTRAIERRLRDVEALPGDHLHED